MQQTVDPITNVKSSNVKVRINWRFFYGDIFLQNPVWTVFHTSRQTFCLALPIIWGISTTQRRFGRWLYYRVQSTGRHYTSSLCHCCLY